MRKLKAWPHLFLVCALIVCECACACVCVREREREREKKRERVSTRKRVRVRASSSYLVQRNWRWVSGLCGTIKSKMVCAIVTNKADWIMSQFDDAQIRVMTWATALLEVSLSDTLRETLHATWSQYCVLRIVDLQLPRRLLEHTKSAKTTLQNCITQ